MDKKDQYVASLREIQIRLEKGGHFTADLGNIAAVLKKRLQFYWIGFYLLKDDQLILGPFQGTPACVFLPKGEGVCWKCIETQRTILVTDVNQFSSHITCDPNSKSEIAVPIFDQNGYIRGVLDVDSDVENGFDTTDLKYLKEVAILLKELF